jgi:hypothetical protein
MIVALVLFVADAGWLILRSTRPNWFGWTISMPALERDQIANPSNALFTFHSWDPRVPLSSVADPYQPNKPSMFRDIMACRPAAIFMEWGSSRPPQMPPRYYVYGREKALAECAARTLPHGYEIAAGDTVPRGQQAAGK